MCLSKWLREANFDSHLHKSHTLWQGMSVISDQRQCARWLQYIRATPCEDREQVRDPGLSCSARRQWRKERPWVKERCRESVCSRCWWKTSLRRWKWFQRRSRSSCPPRSWRRSWRSRARTSKDRSLKWPAPTGRAGGVGSPAGGAELHKWERPQSHVQHGLSAPLHRRRWKRLQRLWAQVVGTVSELLFKSCRPGHSVEWSLEVVSHKRQSF